MKRAFDIVISLLALICARPVPRADRRRSQARFAGPGHLPGRSVGRDGRIFQILKFRTMYETPASYSGPRVTAHDDPRVTPLGRWLRNTKLNELPQFWNVLSRRHEPGWTAAGRPDARCEWPAEGRAEILSVRPGITSPASVLYHNEEALLCSHDVFRKYVQEVGPDKLRLDQLYVRHRSFCLDLDTLLWTALIMCRGCAPFEPPESLLIRRAVHALGPQVRQLVRTRLAGRPVRGRMRGARVAHLRATQRRLAQSPRRSPRLRAAVQHHRRRPRHQSHLLVKGPVRGCLRPRRGVARGRSSAFAFNLWARVLPLGLLVLASILALCGFVASDIAPVS